MTPEAERDYLRAVAAVRAALGTPGERAAIDSVAREFWRVPIGECLRCEAALARDSAEAAHAACKSLLGTTSTATLAEVRKAFSARFQP